MEGAFLSFQRKAKMRVTYKVRRWTLIIHPSVSKFAIKHQPSFEELTSIIKLSGMSDETGVFNTLNPATK